jgi:flagellar FliJ protein
VNGTSFRFRLERLRALRERKEDLARQELARAIARLGDSRARLSSFDSDLQQARTEQREAYECEVLSGDQLKAHQAFLERVEARRSAGVREIEHEETRVADRDAELGLAAREHAMLERLRDRARAEYDRDRRREESNTLDEIATERFGRTAA